jgi:PST family polysaccharide transporter
MPSFNILNTVKTKLRNPVVLNIFWLSFDKVLRILIGLIVGVWIARYLGPAQWGELNYVLAIVSIIVTVTNLGMDGFLVKEVLESPEQKNEILGTAFLMRLTIIPFTTCIALFYFYVLNIELVYYYLFAFLSLNFLIAPFDLIDLEFQSKLQSRLTVVSKNCAYVIGAAAKIYLLLSQKSIIWFAAVMGLETVLAYLFLTFNYQRKYNILDWSFSKTLVKKFLTIGWPFIISNFAIILYMRIDQVMIGNIAGKMELGLFSSAAKITDMFVFIPVAVCSSYMPILVKSKKEGTHKEFVQNIQFFLNWMAKISILLAVIISLFSFQIVKLLYGVKYIEAYKILIIHVWALIPMYLGAAAGQYLVIENLQKYHIYKSISGLILNVGLNIFLIPEYGAIGAAVATLISYFVSAIFSNYFFGPTKLLFSYQLKSIRMLFSFAK